MTDPYAYPGTTVLRNKLDIHDAEALEQAERLLTLQQHREGIPRVELSPAGYQAIHRHLFQDLYDWAGEFRTVNIAKGGHMFCLAPHIETQLAHRFEALHREGDLRGLPAEQFATRAAEHLSELNAIHPFREGNGRTQRAFLEIFADQAGHRLDQTRIEPGAWNEASRVSFATGEAALMQCVIADALITRTTHKEGAQGMAATDWTQEALQRLENSDAPRDPASGRGRTR